jgi:hypothetical protein
VSDSSVNIDAMVSRTQGKESRKGMVVEFCQWICSCGFLLIKVRNISSLNPSDLNILQTLALAPGETQKILGVILLR